MSRRAWLIFGAVSVVWGMPYLFIKVAVEDGLSPLFISFVRVALAAAVLLPIAHRLGALRGLRARWKPLLTFAIFEAAIPFPLIAFGEQHVSSGLTAIIISALPLTIAVLAIFVDEEERVRGARLAGLFVGLAGVIVLFGVDVAGTTDELLGALAILVATVGYAVGPLIVKRHLGGTEPLGSVAAALAITTVLLAPFAAVSLPETAPQGGTWAALAALGLVCTALAFVLYFTLIGDVGPSRASVITYVNPVVAVALGVTLLGESLSASAVAGLLLILAGSFFATGGRPPSGLARIIARRGRGADVVRTQPASGTRRTNSVVGAEFVRGA